MKSSSLIEYLFFDKDSFWSRSTGMTTCFNTAKNIPSHIKMFGMSLFIEEFMKKPKLRIKATIKNLR